MVSFLAMTCTFPINIPNCTNYLCMQGGWQFHSYSPFALCFMYQHTFNLPGYGFECVVKQGKDSGIGEDKRDYQLHNCIFKKE